MPGQPITKPGATPIEAFAEAQLSAPSGYTLQKKDADVLTTSTERSHQPQEESGLSCLYRTLLFPLAQQAYCFWCFCSALFAQILLPCTSNSDSRKILSCVAVTFSAMLLPLPLLSLYLVHGIIMLCHSVGMAARNCAQTVFRIQLLSHPPLVVSVRFMRKPSEDPTLSQYSSVNAISI